jgi:hypothetical protein
MRDELGAGLNFADPSSPLAPLYLRASHVVAVVVLAGVFVLSSHFPVWYTDVWGHLRFGEAIVRTGELPRREPFSGPFTDPEAPYVNYYWLAQAGAYLAFELGRQLAAPDFDHHLGGGVALLATSHALILTLRFLVLLGAFHRLTGSLPLALLGVGLAFVLGLYHLSILRPQVLGEVAFACLLLALSRPVLSRRALVLVPLVFVIWANCHGSFLVGLALLGLVASGDWLLVAGDWLKSHLTPSPGPPVLPSSRPPWRRTLTLVLSLTAVALLNPHGPFLLGHSWGLAQHANVGFMEEWKPLPLTGLGGMLFLGSVLLLVPLLRWSPARFTPAQVLVLAGFGWQVLAHARMIGWWAMVLPWVAVPHLHAVYRRYLPPVLDETGRPDLRKTVLAAAAGAALWLWSAPAAWWCWGQAPRASQLVSARTPLAVARYLEDQYRRHAVPRGPVFASETLGDYLLWDLRLDPPVHVFCYTHVHLFTPEHWRECLAVKNGDPGWQAVLDRHRVQFVVVEAELHPRLVEHIRLCPERWEENKQVGWRQGIFVAKRIAAGAPGG